MKYLPLAFLTFLSEIFCQEVDDPRAAGVFDSGVDDTNLIPTTQQPGTIMPAPKGEKTNIATILAHYKANMKQNPDFDKNWPEYPELAARGFSGQIGNTINSLHEYGCWCYFYEYGRGRGVPQDPIDEACKALQYGYECAIRDGEDEGNFCVPWEVEYVNAVGGTVLNLIEDCANVNPGDLCAARACAIEQNFIINLLDIFVSGYSDDYQLKHSNGFDPEVTCATGSRVDVLGQDNYDQADISCCGYYPDRKPFNTQHGDRACCLERTYNAVVSQCCPNGQVKAYC